MSLDILLSNMNENQKRIMEALFNHPKGLLSRELASITGVSNKSDTMKPSLRAELKQCGWELVIEREKNCYRWSLQPYVEACD